MFDETRFYTQLGLRIQRARRNLGLTQEKLATMVSLGRTSIVNIEKGRQKMLAHTFAALVLALRTSPADILPDSSEAAPSGIDQLMRHAPKLAREFVRSALASTPIQKED